MKVSKWLLRGMSLVRLLQERFNTSKKSRFTSCVGILPWSLFDERSKDSSCDKLLKDDGIGPIKLLWEKLRTTSEWSSPSISGTCPLNWLFEKSITIKVVKIFVNSNFNPFVVINRDSICQVLYLTFLFRPIDYSMQIFEKLRWQTTIKIIVR